MLGYVSAEPNTCCPENAIIANETCPNGEDLWIRSCPFGAYILFDSEFKINDDESLILLEVPDKMIPTNR